MNTIQSHCSVTFIPRTDEANYIRVLNSGVNEATLGMWGGFAKQ